MTTGHGVSVAEVLTEAIASDVSRLARADEALARDLDPPNVHRARVATRRLRSDLRVFGDYLDQACATSLREELGWLGDELGRVRDLDVLDAELRVRVNELSDADAGSAPKLLDRLRVQRKEAGAALGSALRAERSRHVLAQLSSFVAAPPITAAAEGSAMHELPGLMEGPWRRLRRAANAAGEEPTDVALHRIRIRAKRVRYAAEALGPVGGRSLGRVARRATDVQRILGEHQDAVVAASWLRDQAAGATPKVAFAAGMLAAQEEARRTQTRGRWPQTWERLLEATAKAWDR